MFRFITEELEAPAIFLAEIFQDMTLPQLIAGFLALFDAIGLPGNLLVIVTIALERRFHVMRYILLASIAVSDFLCLILSNSFRIASIAQERWLYGQTMCYLNPFFGRYFYLNTILHLIAVSYERYNAIVKSPLTYDGTITKTRVVFIILIWVVPIPISIAPFLGWGKYVYNPEVFFCEQGWSRNSIAAQAGGPRLREMSRRRSERKAAVDVSIIIAAFLLCFLPSGSLVFAVSSSRAAKFQPSSLCNPIIYSIRKREFRTGVKNVLRRIGACRGPYGMNDNGIGVENLSFETSLDSEAYMNNLSFELINLATGSPRETAAQVTQHRKKRFCERLERPGVNFLQRSYLAPIQEVDEEQPNMTELPQQYFHSSLGFSRLRIYNVAVKELQGTQQSYMPNQMYKL
ncbi:hypothetical protein OS493_029489 [Desmophyllum pertusum]|uniref:G-protein coupled receptors family 1 profile domain-containing protein n=1 Tax=Desmophyllum pertusum TaxID=174260 RepID=A0A9X0CDB2_9CNID|nr:hypothetical protein OS493_029489 [Desmophyllum pertusum]